MAGGYAAFVLQSVVAAGPLILVAVAVIMFFVGLVLALVAYFPLMRRPPATIFISTLLCGIFLQNMFVVVFGPEARAGPPLFTSSLVRLGPIEISQQAVGIVSGRRGAGRRCSSLCSGVPRSAASCAQPPRTARWRRRSASRRWADDRNHLRDRGIARRRRRRAARQTSISCGRPAASPLRSSPIWPW